MPTFTRERESAGRIIMENQREIYEALLAGEVLKDLGTSFVRLNSDDDLCTLEGKSISEPFDYPENWQIYTKPEWYDNIPEGGVLCWNLDSRGEQSNYTSSIHENMVVNKSNYKPLTKQEIQVFANNAPED